MIRLLLNLLWAICGGFVTALEYVLAGLLLSVLFIPAPPLKTWFLEKVTFFRVGLLPVLACAPGGKGTGVRQVAFPEMQPLPPGPVKTAEQYRGASLLKR